jgi:hypothetical protein
MLLPALLFAAGNSSPVTVLPQEGAVPTGAALVTSRPARGGAPFKVDIGSVDTIGGTTYDWQANGPAVRTLVNTPGYGIHVTWMYSASTQTTFPDRNMRYNYYDLLARAWNWIDPDYMQSGVNTFTVRTGYGSIDVDTNGVAVISAHHTTSAGTAPIVARDADVGCGIFEYAPGEPTIDQFEWPWVGVSMNGAYQLAMLDYVSQDNLYWSRSTAWPTWQPAVSIPSPEPEPLFPDHNIATSKVAGSNKVCITWVLTPASGYQQAPGFYRESPDGGDNWDPPVDIGFPPAFSPGSETLPSFHITSLFPFYDKQDRLHIVGNVGPYVRDTNWILPGEIWHWCAANPDTWNLIHIASPESLNAQVGYNTMICARPSLGEDEWGNLFVAWEEFDGVNVEPTTSRLRADIWAAGSTDGGVNWSTPLKLTTAGTASCRFPSICDLPWPGDSLAVVYEVDLCAGFFLYAEGPATNNPIVVQKVPIDSIVQRGPYSGRIMRPNRGEVLVGGDTFNIMWTVTPKTFFFGVLSLSTDDGGTFPTVLGESIPPAETTLLWDPVPQLNCSRCRVKFDAVDSFGATVFSDRSDANFTIDCDTPPAPVMVYPKPDTAINNPSVVFRWRKAPDTSGIAYYRLQVAYDSLFLAMADTARRTETTYTRQLTPDTVYYWRLMARDRARHDGQWTPAARFEIDAQTPGIPTLLEPVGGTWLRSPDVVFRWTAVQFDGKVRPSKPRVLSPVRYIVSVDTAATNIDLWVDTLSATTDTLTVPWQHRYWWKVRAFDLAGNTGPATAPSSFGFDTTQPPVATLVFPPDSGVIRTDTTSLIWRSVRDNASGVSHYHLQLAPDTMFTETLVVTDTVRLVTLPGEGAYYWHVQAVDSAGNVGEWSLRRTFTYSAVGVSENRLELGTEVRLLKPAPNPFTRTTVVRLVLPRDMSVAADVYNAAGQRVRSLASGLGCAGAHSLVWDGTDAGGRRVQAGVYYLRITAEGGTVTQAVVLSR